MKTILSILFFFSISNVKAQNIDAIKLSKVKESVICFYCVNENSKVVTEVSKLIKAKKYEEIQKLMLSKNPAEKYLAAVTFEKLIALKKVTGNDAEKKLIKEVYNSKDTLYTYSNDTYIQAKPIKDYIYSKEDNLIWSQTEKWLEKILK
ncbi:hypothetical protein L1S35_05335 [Flavobacterium sp. AS60]|uniref:hypothetical protein n=1 Tax=Flavobacterium anseongense TaxID=2910677 RepID=UPI001F1F7CEF|nr:hypothetical protein [Flavobacterium sp. AS60]MCF6129088.1 hypothetical protein [Flavobacterium sp. AS60]